MAMVVTAVLPSIDTLINDMTYAPFDLIPAGLSLKLFESAGQDIQKTCLVVVDDETV